jgi:type I restriction enzyme S subunit
MPDSPAWPVIPLDEAGEWLSGGTPNKSTAEYWGGDLPWASAKDMKVFELRDTEDHITEKGLLEGSQPVEPGTILIVVRGMILAHTFPVAIASRRMGFNQDIKAIRCDDRVDPRYLAHWLNSQQQQVLCKVTDTSHGTKRLDTRYLQQHPFPRPPLWEQRAIAAVLDAADAAIERTCAAVEATRRVKRGLVQQFFEAGLGRVSCADSPNAKPAKGWRLVCAGKLLLGEPKNGISPTTESAPPGFITFSIAAVRDGRVNLLNREHWKYARIPSEDAEPYRLNRGDLLIVRGNANPDLVGKCGIVEDMPPDCIYPDILKRVHFDTGPDGVDPRFVEIAWNHAVVHNQILKRAKTSNGTLKVNSRDVKQIVMPLPPRNEQERLVATVCAAEDLEHSLVATLTAHERLKCGLMQMLLTGRVRVPVG